MVSNHTQVIFEKGLDSAARVVAGHGEALERLVPMESGVRKKVPLILQHRGLLSNGYVGLGPWRSEFFMTPPQNPFHLGSLSWLDLPPLN